MLAALIGPTVQLLLVFGLGWWVISALGELWGVSDD